MVIKMIPGRLFDGLGIGTCLMDNVCANMINTKETGCRQRKDNGCNQSGWIWPWSRTAKNEIKMPDGSAGV